MSTPPSFEKLLEEFQQHLIRGSELKNRYENAMNLFRLRAEEYITITKQGNADRERLDKIRLESLSYAEETFDVIDEIARINEKARSLFKK